MPINIIVYSNEKINMKHILFYIGIAFIASGIVKLIDLIIKIAKEK